MRNWGTLAAVILAACQATPQIASAADGSNEVRFKLYRGYAIIVRGSIGNLKNLNFLVDTGAVPSVLDGRIASQLGVEMQDGQLSVLTKKLTTRHAIAPVVRLGPLQVQNLPVVVQNLAFAEDALGTRVDAMIGFDLLGQTPFTIDYRSKTIIFGPVDPSFATLPYRPGLPFVMVDLQVQQETIGIVVDTGASDLVLFESGIRDCRAAISTTQERTWSNMGGDIRVKKVQLSNAHLGTMLWGRRTAYVLDNNREKIAGVAGVLGTVALKAERVAFDPERKVLAWEQTRDQGWPQTRATPGVVEHDDPDLETMSRVPKLLNVAQKSEVSNLLIIREYNDAHLSESMLSEAQMDVARVFGRAGISISFVECGRGIGEAIASCQHAPGLTHLVLRILPGARAVGDSIFGVAFLSAEGTGAYSDVFYDSIAKLHIEWPATASRVLGHVMAHEIGHLLLGSNAHSAMGIMTPSWNRANCVVSGWGHSYSRQNKPVQCATDCLLLSLHSRLCEAHGGRAGEMPWSLGPVVGLAAPIIATHHFQNRRGN